jgi:acylphosphatase
LNERAAAHLIVTGRVQGVGFRWHARERARELGLAGWIRNLADGRVEAWIEGEPVSVGQMRAWLEHGPPGARVERVEARSVLAEGLTGFDVQREI